MNRPLVALKNVEVTYNKGQGSKEINALKDVSLEIFPHEYIIFFGPSGCGKSTLMNVVAGLEKITKGKVSVAGKDISALSDEDLATYHRHQVGFIFQAYNLITTLSVLENIALPQMFEGIGTKEWKRKAFMLAEKFEISEQTNKLPTELSGGQQQRVGIARALINNPSLLLADEPSGNLDSKNTLRVFDIFRKLNLREKKTILLVTHAPDFLNEADRIFYMKDGRIVDEVKNKTRRKTVAEKEDVQKVYPWGSLMKDKYVPPSIKSEKLSEFILAVPPEKQMTRIETLIEKRLQSMIGPLELVSSLDKSYYRGGAGLNKRRAEKIGFIVEHVIAHSKIINNLAAARADEAASVVQTLCQYLKEAVRVKLTDSQIKIFEILMMERLHNKISPWEVKRMLDISVKKGGLGLRKQAAQKLVNYLELIILIAAKSQNAPPL